MLAEVWLPGRKEEVVLRVCAQQKALGSCKLLTWALPKSLKAPGGCPVL